MANQEHLAILKQGVEVWNQWRETYPEVFPELQKADLTGIQLAGANFAWTDFYKADLEGADLQATELSHSDFWHASIRNANVTGANLKYAYLNHTNAEGAVFKEVDFLRTVLTSSNFTNADFSGANLIFTDLREATFDRAKFGDTILGMVAFGDNDLSTLQGIETIKHIGPSYLSIDCLYRSGGNIPEIFLRGCGVPEDFISFARSLVVQPFELYSCFISHSTRDAKFVQRLYADLQNKGVRCWYAPEDLKIGDKFRQEIDRAIRLHDKLLLILSENSVQSAWVEEEVESALERERRDKREVLFPIRLDDAVMETEQAWAASLRRMRHIGDFTSWKQHDDYRRAFERLLRDLQVS